MNSAAYNFITNTIIINSVEMLQDRAKPIELQRDTIPPPTLVQRPSSRSQESRVNLHYSSPLSAVRLSDNRLLSGAGKI